ncbi:MSHA biogenesis protein MshF [Vibrio sp. YMD68]|uniref:MSHA biogenesis protein MshF n=1 Tax=Vibrio sp. YMD68 TaxID=3042300 RepID=UPI00249BDFB0|nr:MSHA biogenesis protein MshF [Vibrio sp. YMD68]WGV99964.1 MSHA biogenesis protein MshF [Vibrio sp. YMD68]
MLVDNARSQFVIWLLLVIILVLSFMLAWKSVDEEASETALLLASKRVVERASFYKQEWLLHKQPSKLVIDGRVLAMSDQGWVLPLDQNQQVNCAFWLQVLYPENRQWPAYSESIERHDKRVKYQCRYLYASDQVIVIQLDNGNFTVSVDFLTQA